MKQFIRRLLLAIPMLVVVTFLVFVLVDLAPGDAATTLAGDNPTPERIAEVRKSLGLDDPLLVRYGRWLTHAVRGDLGHSLQTGEPVLHKIIDGAAVTLSLVIVSIIISTIIAIIVGTIAAMRNGKIVDRIITTVSAAAIAAPPFWIGMVLILWLALKHSFFPALGYVGFGQDKWEWFKHMLLPAVALGALPGAELAMQLKGSLVEELGRDYVLTARARGIGNMAVVFKHAMKNAMIPVVTVFGFRLAQLLGGTITVEALFFLNGIGTQAVTGAKSRDVTMLLGLTVVLTLVVIVINLIVDTSYRYFNPAEPTMTIEDPMQDFEGVELDTAPQAIAARPGWRRLVRRFAASKPAVVGLVIIIALVVVAIFPYWFAPKDPDRQDLVHKFKAGVGVLGTDELGRDVLSRLIWGARVSVIAGSIAVGIAAGVGVPLGIIAGHIGKGTDAVLSRISEALQSVPALIFALTVIAVLGPGLVNAMIAVGIVTIPRFFRVARAAAIDVTGNTYIEAARALGCSPSRVMWRHVLPNTLGPLVVQVALTFGGAITAEASLSYLGLGVSVPTASWGAMLTNGARDVNRAAYLVYTPGLAIVITVLAFMFVGDGLRQALGTRQIIGTEG